MSRLPCRLSFFDARIAEVRSATLAVLWVPDFGLLAGNMLCRLHRPRPASWKKDLQDRYYCSRYKDAPKLNRKCLSLAIMHTGVMLLSYNMLAHTLEPRLKTSRLFFVVVLLNGLEHG